MLIALLMFLGLCAALWLGNMRTTCGSRVRRSLRFMFLNKADLVKDALKKYYREYYPSRALEVSLTH